MAASVAQLGDTPRPVPVTRVVAVLSAMTVEIETLDQEFTDKKELIVQGFQFTTGSLKERKVVLAQSGIGKVNAATAATYSSSRADRVSKTMSVNGIKRT